MMSGGVRGVASTNLRRVLAQWPQDILRPNLQLQNFLARRLEDGPQGATWARLDATAQLKQVNALYSLLENRYSLKYKPSELLMQPRSKPTYYTDLITELDEAPTLTWLGRLQKRMSSMVSKSLRG